MTQQIVLTPAQEEDNLSKIVGNFIRVTNDVEGGIDNIIASHFYDDDKQIEIYEIFLKRLNLRTKCEILTDILKKFKKWELYSPQLELDKVRDKRNKFAHGTFPYFRDKNENPDYSKIEIITYKNLQIKKDVIQLTDVDDWFNLSKSHLRILENIRKDLFP
jgi:hypothetical protein